MHMEANIMNFLRDEEGLTTVEYNIIDAVLPG